MFNSGRRGNDDESSIDTLITEIIPEEDEEIESPCTSTSTNISTTKCNEFQRLVKKSPLAAAVRQVVVGQQQESKAGDNAAQSSSCGLAIPVIAAAREDSESSVAARLDYRSRRPSLITVTLPATPETVSTDTRTPSSNSKVDSYGNESDSDNEGRTTPPLMRSISPTSNFGRSKTRLLDPPPITPAIRNQITSTLKSRRFANSEVKFAPTPTPTPTSALKSVSFEEEQDPLDDESIPEHKNLNKGESAWLRWIQWLCLCFLIALLVVSLKIKKIEGVSWLQLSLWRWQALALVILSGRLIASLVVKFFVALIERRFLLKKRVLYFVYGLRKSVKNCIWIGLVLVVWEVIFSDHDETKTVTIVTKVLWCLFTASISWMLKVLILKMAANSFHRSAYFERMQDCLFNQYLLETLSAPPAFSAGVDPKPDHQEQKLQMFHTRREPNFPGPSDWNSGKEIKVDVESAINVAPKTQGDWKTIIMSPFKHTKTTTTQESGDKQTPTKKSFFSPKIKRSATMGAPAPIIAKSPVPIEQSKLQQLTSETVSAWTLRRIMKTIRSKNMTTYSSMLAHEKVEKEIDSETEARFAAKQIFYNMARPGQKYLLLKDFLYFLPEEQATRAYSLFEITEQGNITKRSLMKWVVSVYKERRALALTLNDNKTVVAKLHRVFDSVLAVVLFIICLLIIGVNTSKLLVFFSSIFIPSVFVFGNMAKGTFEALIFLFIVHPYDVGDRVCVDGQTLLVEEMNVLNTIFLTGSNEKVYYPNSVLAIKPISNFHRSPDQWDAIEFQINVTTPVEKLGALKDKLQRYIESFPQFWYPDFRIICKDIENSNKMRMALWMQHHLNFQEGGERFQRRSNMLLYMKQQLEDLGITYQLPRQEVIVTGIPLLDVPVTPMTLR